MYNPNLRYSIIGFGIMMAVIAVIIIARIKMPIIVVVVLVFAALAVLLVPILYIRNTVASFDGATITVKGAVVDISIPMTKLRSVEMRETIETGDIQKAASNGYKVSGTFKNREFGEYQISADLDEKKFIVIRYGGSILVFNLKTAEATEAFFAEIVDQVPSRGESARDIHLRKDLRCEFVGDLLAGTYHEKTCPLQKFRIVICSRLLGEEHSRDEIPELVDEPDVDIGAPRSEIGEIGTGRSHHADAGDLVPHGPDELLVLVPPIHLLP